MRRCVPAPLRPCAAASLRRCVPAPLRPCAAASPHRRVTAALRPHAGSPQRCVPTFARPCVPPGYTLQLRRWRVRHFRRQCLRRVRHCWSSAVHFCTRLGDQVAPTFTSLAECHFRALSHRAQRRFRPVSGDHAAFDNRLRHRAQRWHNDRRCNNSGNTEPQCWECQKRSSRTELHQQSRAAPLLSPFWFNGCYDPKQ